MTAVHVDLRKPQADGSFLASAGVLRVSLLHRQTESTYVVVEDTFDVPLTAGETVLELAPSAAGNAWRVQERIVNGITRTVIVPDVAAVEYAALADVDPNTLQPGAAVEAWTEVLSQVQAAADAVSTSITATISPRDPGLLRIAFPAAVSPGPNLIRIPIGAES